jgi:hypothetical protein
MNSPLLCGFCCRVSKDPILRRDVISTMLVGKGQSRPNWRGRNKKEKRDANAHQLVSSFAPVDPILKAVYVSVNP